MEKALISLGEKDLRSLIDENEGAELVCHFCHSKYFFTTEELQHMLDNAHTANDEPGEDEEE